MAKCELLQLESGCIDYTVVILFCIYRSQHNVNMDQSDMKYLNTRIVHTRLTSDHARESD